MNNYYHPEKKETEIFIANTRQLDIPKKFRHLKTIRLGRQAYCINGSKLSPTYMLPMFVGKSDYNELNRIWQDKIDSKRRDR